MIDERLGEELKRYGLEGMAGDPVDVLLRHIYANHEAALGAKDGTIASLESQNQALQEENERLGKMLVELNDAQVVQEKALLAIRDSKHAVPPVDASECRAIARNALSPTQETDPG
jgi:hypothetical protein